METHKKKALQLARLFKQLQIVGGLDGTRTRDPPEYSGQEF